MSTRPSGLMRWGSAGWLAACAVLAAAGVVLFQLGAHGLRNSDNATPMLQAWDMLAGNWDLARWVMPSDTNWTTEVPGYLVAAGLGESGASALVAVPVALYLLIALLAVAAVVRGDGWRRGWPGATVTLVLLLAVSPLYAYVALRAGMVHPGAAWAPLLAFQLVAGERTDWRLAVVAAAVLTLAAVGDPLVLVTGALPMVAAALPLIRGRRSSAWAAAAGLAAVPGWYLLTGAVAAAGGVRPVVVPVAAVAPAEWPAHLATAWSNLAALLDVPQLPGAIALAAALAWWALLLGAVVALGVRTYRSGARLLDLLLLSAAIVGFLAYALTDRSTIPLTARYLVPSVVSAAALIGRGVNALENRRPLLAAALTATVLVAGARAATMYQTYTTPISPDPVVAVERWLLAHGYERGYSPYWEANYTTVISDRRLLVRGVRGEPGRVVSDHWLSRPDWFAPSPEESGARFVFFSDQPAGANGLDTATVVSALGPPAAIAHVDGYTIVVWSHDISSQVPW